MTADDQPRRQLTVRLSVPMWRRVKELALALDCTTLELIIAGLNRIFAEQGLEPLDPDSTIVPPKKRRG